MVDMYFLNKAHHHLQLAAVRPTNNYAQIFAYYAVLQHSKFLMHSCDLVSETALN